MPGCSRRGVVLDIHQENVTMYEMYPDWGPASHHPDNPLSYEAVQESLDLRDNGGQRPDDN
jgi:hypothetical protein